MSEQTNRRRILTGVCMAALAIFFAVNPVTQVMARGTAHSVPAIAAVGFTAPLQMGLMMGAVLGIVQLLRRRADRAGLTGATLTLLGWTVGMRITTLGQMESLITSGITNLPQDTLQRMFDAAPIVWVSIVPMGLLFPIGLITLGVTLVVARPVPRWIGALLIAGGILFPVGRAVRLPWAVTACDLVLATAFGTLGWLVLTRAELWAPAEEAEGARRTYSDPDVVGEANGLPRVQSV